MQDTRPIAIDVREACRAKRDGKGQWTYGFVTELLRQNIPVHLFTDAALPLEWNVASEHVTQLPVRGLLWHLHVSRLLQQKNEWRFYVSPTSYIVPAIAKGIPCIPVVHDLIAFRGEPHNRRATFIERLTLGRAVKKAAHILTISESTKADLLARFPSLSPASVTTVYAGPLRMDAANNIADEKTIVCIATLSPRKNQERLIKAFASLPSPFREHYKLILVGARGWNDEGVVSLAKETPGVEWRGYASAQDYEDLLSHCTVFALPSLYEGFGMQILDALQRGCAVLTSDRGSLKEVVGDSAMIVNPENVESIATGLRRLLEDTELRQQLSTAGPKQVERFSWEKTVGLFLRGVEQHK